MTRAPKNVSIDPKVLLEDMEKELARRSYAAYLSYSTNGVWKPHRHLMPLVDVFQRILDGEQNLRIIINLPPQVGKSFTGTKSFPARYLAQFPEHRVMVTTYGDDLAKEFGASNRDAFERKIPELFDVQIDPSRRADKDFAVYQRNGSFYATTLQSGATGKSANLLIIDDPIKNSADANSQLKRDKIYNEWRKSFFTRLQSGSNVVIIMTRWHEDDLTGKLLTDGSFDWEHIVVTAEAEENDILGRQPGEAIAPELGKDAKWIADTKRTVGTLEFNGMYQQRPAPAGGSIFKDKWFRYYSVLPKFDSMAMSWDCTFKGKKDSDYVVGQIWGKLGPDFYLVYEKRDRMEFTDTLTAMRQVIKLFPKAFAKLIEDKANGTAIMNVLKKETSGIIEIEPAGDKIARAQACSPLFEAGNVYIPHPDSHFVFSNGQQYSNAWVEDYKTELKNFPNAANDDRVDATSQMLNWWNVPVKDAYVEPRIRGSKNKKKSR